MNRPVTICFFLIVAAAVFSAPRVIAQDAVAVAPKVVKVILDNERVRVLDFSMKAGDKIPMHSHPAWIVYAVTGAKVKTMAPDGKTTEGEFKAGDIRWNDAVTHANEALSDGHVIVVELKEPAKLDKNKQEMK